MSDLRSTARLPFDRARLSSHRPYRDNPTDPETISTVATAVPWRTSRAVGVIPPTTHRSGEPMVHRTKAPNPPTVQANWRLRNATLWNAMSDPSFALVGITPLASP